MSLADTNIFRTWDLIQTKLTNVLGQCLQTDEECVLNDCKINSLNDLKDLCFLYI